MKISEYRHSDSGYSALKPVIVIPERGGRDHEAVRGMYPTGNRINLKLIPVSPHQMPARCYSPIPLKPHFRILKVPAKMLLPDDPYIINFYRGQDVGSHSAALFAESDNLPVEIKEISREHRSPDGFCKFAILHPKRVGHLDREIPAHGVCRVCPHHAVDVDCRFIKEFVAFPVHDKIVVADRGKPGKPAPDGTPGGCLPARYTVLRS